MQISDEQLAKLRGRKELEFVDRLCAHGREHFPRRCAHLGEEELRSVTRSIVADARARGLRSERGIGIYFNVAVSLGTTFMSNPAIRWAGPIARLEDEPLEPDWITRLGGTAVRTLRKHGR